MVTRRVLLNRAGAYFSVGTLATLAGCTGSGSPSNSVVPPKSGRPTYRSWLPEPGEVGRSDRNSYNVNYISIDDLRSMADADPKFAEFYLDPVLKKWSFLGLADDEIIDVTTIKDVDQVEGAVIRGEFDRESMLAALESAGFSREGTIRDFDHYSIPSPDRAIVVNDTAIAYARSSDASSMVGSMIDAKYGDGVAYHEANSDFELLTTELGSQSVVKIDLRERYSTTIPETFAFEGSKAHGFSRELTESDIYTRLVVPFVDEATANTDVVREAVDGDGSKFDSVSVYRDGRTVFVDGRTSIDD